MSNEYKDYYEDLYCEFEDRVEALDFLPDGWVKSFVPKLKEELFDIIGSYTENFEIMQAKQKWGELRVYWCWEDKDYSDLESADMNKLYGQIENILEKYTAISRETCAVCGKLSTSYTTGLVLPVCEECKEEGKR